MGLHRDNNTGLEFYYYGDSDAPAGDRSGSQKYYDIVDDARQNGYPWDDPLFPADDSSLGDNLDLKYSDGTPLKIKWRRATEIAKDMFDSDPIFHGPFNQFGVNQGVVGDCWFLSVLADAAVKPECIETICPGDNERIDFAVGAYHFRFWFKGKWIDVPVDDKLPCIIYDGKITNTAFCKPTKEGGFWAPLLEKAYAKLYGKYDKISNGNGTEAMQDFTGGFVSIHLIDEPDLLKTLKDARKQDAIIGWSTKIHVPDGRARAYDPKNPGKEGVSADGIVMNHEYSVLDVQDVTDSNTGDYITTLLKLRNPWGNDTEWTGDWSDSDPNGLWQTVSQGDLRGNSTLTDGQFWMAWEDVQTYSREFDICRWSGKDRGIKTMKGPDGGIDFIVHGYFTAENSSLPSSFQSSIFQGKAGYWAHLNPLNPDDAAKGGNSCKLYINILDLNYNKSGTNPQIPSFGFYMLNCPGNYAPTDQAFFDNLGDNWLQSKLVISCRGLSYQAQFPANTSVFILPWITDPPSDDTREPYLLRISSWDTNEIHCTD